MNGWWKILVALVLVVAMVGCRPSVAPDPSKPPDISTFLWVHDATRGVALSYPVRIPHGVSAQMGTLRVDVLYTDPLMEYWDIDEAAAYYWEDGKRRRCLVEGPFVESAWDNVSGGRVFRHRTWLLSRLSRPEYEVVLLLHKRKDGIPPSKVAEMVRRHGRRSIGVIIGPRIDLDDYKQTCSLWRFDEWEEL